MRVFFDTNVLASAVATRGLCADVLQVTLAEHQLIVGENILSELRRVLVDKFAVTKDLADETDEFLRTEAEVITNPATLQVSVRDPDDVAVLEHAVAGKADVLVTGDRDLLEMTSEVAVRVISPRAFWDLLREPIPEEE